MMTMGIVQTTTTAVVSSSSSSGVLRFLPLSFPKARKRRSQRAMLSPSRASSAAAGGGDASAPKPWLFVGLGNPGKIYQGTRHNVGFDMVDAIAEAEGISVNSIRSKALFGKGMTKSEQPMEILKAGTATTGKGGGADD